MPEHIRFMYKVSFPLEEIPVVYDIRLRIRSCMSCRPSAYSAGPSAALPSARCTLEPARIAFLTTWNTYTPALPLQELWRTCRLLLLPRHQRVQARQHLLPGTKAGEAKVI